jgi:hypothetical protein
MDAVQVLGFPSCPSGESGNLLKNNYREKQRLFARNALRLCDSKPQAQKLHLNREDAKLAVLAEALLQQLWHSRAGGKPFFLTAEAQRTRSFLNTTITTNTARFPLFRRRLESTYKITTGTDREKQDRLRGTLCGFAIQSHRGESFI